MILFQQRYVSYNWVPLIFFFFFAMLKEVYTTAYVFYQLFFAPFFIFFLPKRFKPTNVFIYFVKVLCHNQTPYNVPAKFLLFCFPSFSSVRVRVCAPLRVKMS